MNQIMALRKKKNMTREELSMATGIPFLTLRAYELRERNPKTKRALKLAEVLGVDVNDL